MEILLAGYKNGNYPKLTSSPLRQACSALSSTLISTSFFTGYIKNLSDKERDDVILVHSQEEPTIPVSAGPCE